MKDKIQICLLYGGQSCEHEVSCRSAAYVLKNLSADKYDLVAVGVTPDGRWIPQELDPQWRDPGVKTIPIADINSSLSPAPSGFGPKSWFEDLFASAGMAMSSNAPRVVFPALHGPMGEDGTVQGLCELAEIAFVGSDTLGSALTMNKSMARDLIGLQGIAVTEQMVVHRSDWNDDKTTLLDQLSGMNFPLFVKPNALGSSVGVSKVAVAGRLESAIERAFAFEDWVVVEQGVVGREFECAVIGDQTVQSASGVAEIVVSDDGDFYDYQAKYLKKEGATLVSTASISEQLRDEIRELSCAVFKCLRMHGLGRIDFLYDESLKKVFFSEANAIPGLTSISQFPVLWELEGLSGQKLCDRLVDLALNRLSQTRLVKRARSYEDCRP